MASLSRTYAPDCGDLTLGGAVLEEAKSLRILAVTFDSKLTFETNLREVVSKAARSLGVVRRAGMFFNCPRVIKSYFNAYVLSNFSVVPQCQCLYLNLI